MADPWDSIPNAKTSGFGKRADGTEKGPGFMGTLQRPDGNISTELSIGVTLDGKETEIPSLVPTLTKEETDHLLSGASPTPAIVQKAVDHARQRMAEGKSPFKEKETETDPWSSIPDANPKPEPAEETPSMGVEDYNLYEPEDGGKAQRENLKSVVKGGAEAVGMTAGGLAGAASPIPGGTLIGGGLGYAAGKKVGELAEAGIDYLAGESKPSRTVGEELIESGKDIVTGAAYEGGGALAGKFVFQPVMKGGKWVFDQGKGLFQKHVTERIKTKAAEFWVANTSQGPIYAKNAQEAVDIETAIPGVKFTYGQRTYDPKAIRMERAQIRKPGDAAQASAEQIASNDEALKAYYQKNFAAEGTVDDMLSALQGKREALEQGVEGTKKAASAIESRMAQTKDPNEVSGKLLETLKTEKRHTSRAVSKIYDQIPNVEVPAAGMIDELKAIAKPTSQVENPANFPIVLNKALREYGPKEMPDELKNIVDSYAKVGQPLPKQLADEVAKYGTGDTLKFQELRGLRTEILNEMRSEAAKNNPAAMRRLKDMQDVVEKTIDQLGEEGGKYGEDIVNLYRMASKQWREYADTFKRGAVGNILQGGAKGEVSKLTTERMLSSIFDSKNTAAADQLLKAVGKDKATPMVREYATYDLMRKSVNPMTGEIDRGKLMSWLAKNKPALSKYGLEGEYADIVKAKAAVDEAAKAKLVFEKSQAAKALGVDPEKAVATVFAGKGSTNSAQTARDLMELVKGNQAATEGVKQAFGEYAVSRIQTSMKDIVGNPSSSVAKFNALWQKYAPAMRELYRDSPKKIETLMNMKKAYETMIRNQRSPFGGGSDTAENIFQTLAVLGSPIAQTSRTATAIKAVASKISQREAQLVDQVINQALFNPEYAETLQWLAKGQMIPVAEKRLSGHIAALGIWAANRE